MRKLILPLLFMLLSGAGFAQSTTRITKDSLPFREKYDVLKSNHQIKQGKYMLSDLKSGKILTTGSYKNNKKDGQWHQYNNAGNVIVEGKYKDGQRVGIWNYYGDLWELINKYDYTTHQLLFHKGSHQDSISSYRVIKGNDTADIKLQRPPIYLGGNDMMLRTLMYDLHYPPQALSKNIYGRVVIGFTVDENGHARDHKVIHGLGYGLDEEALRVTKTIPDDWVPGILDGKPVAVVIQLPIAFKLQ